MEGGRTTKERLGVEAQREHNDDVNLILGKARSGIEGANDGTKPIPCEQISGNLRIK